MSSNTEVRAGTGLSTSTLFGVLFTGLKLTGHINWPWVWVLSPFWIPVVISLALLAFAGVCLAVAYYLENRK
jgi:hypothetical protein